MMNGRVDRDKVLEVTDLVALADELVGGRQGNGSGARWPSPVPGHPQTGKSPPMSIFTDRHGTERFMCWATGTGGTAIDLVMVVRGGDFRDAMAWLDERSHGRAQELTPAKRVRKQPALELRQSVRIEKMLSWINRCEQILWTDEGTKARRWLKDRGLNGDDARANHLGYDPGVRHLRRAQGLPMTSGVVWPCYDYEGRAVYAQSRSLRDALMGEGAPKYRNPYGGATVARGAVSVVNPKLTWHKPAGDQLQGALLVCEGVSDAVAAQSAGIHAVGLLGAGLAVRTEVASQIAKRRAGRVVVVALDADDAGQQGATKFIEACAELSIPARMIVSDHGDLGDWLREVGRDEFRVEMRERVNNTIADIQPDCGLGL